MSIDILIVVSSPECAPYLEPMLEAADRASCSVAVFLTNDGVALASANALGNKLAATENAVACADSWTRFAPNELCPITLGSQTDHSQLAGNARKIISF